MNEKIGMHSPKQIPVSCIGTNTEVVYSTCKIHADTMTTIPAVCDNFVKFAFVLQKNLRVTIVLKNMLSNVVQMREHLWKKTKSFYVRHGQTSRVISIKS